MYMNKILSVGVATVLVLGIAATTMMHHNQVIRPFTPKLARVEDDSETSELF
jgi:hypothetical protein